MARSLSPDGYGHYLYALTIAQILAMPVLAGLPTLVTRQIAIYRAHKNWAQLRGIIRWGLGFIAITSGAIALGGLGFLAFWKLPSEGAQVYLLALPLVVVLGLMRLSAAVIQGYEHPFWGTLPDSTLRPVILLALVCSAIWAVRTDTGYGNDPPHHRNGGGGRVGVLVLEALLRAAS